MLNSRGRASRIDLHSTNGIALEIHCVTHWMESEYHGVEFFIRAHTADIITPYDTCRSEVSPAIADYIASNFNLLRSFQTRTDYGDFTSTMPGRSCDLNMMRPVCALHKWRMYCALRIFLLLRE